MAGIRGQLISEKYRLLAVLGEGAMDVVLGVASDLPKLRNDGAHATSPCHPRIPARGSNRSIKLGKSDTLTLVLWVSFSGRGSEP